MAAKEGSRGLSMSVSVSVWPGRAARRHAATAGSLGLCLCLCLCLTGWVGQLAGPAATAGSRCLLIAFSFPPKESAFSSALLITPPLPPLRLLDSDGPRRPSLGPLPLPWPAAQPPVRRAVYSVDGEKSRFDAWPLTAGLGPSSDRQRDRERERRRWGGREGEREREREREGESERGSHVQRSET